MYANIYASRRKTSEKKFLLSTYGATFSFFQGEQLEAIPFTPLGTITMVPLKILNIKMITGTIKFFSDSVDIQYSGMLHQIRFQLVWW